MLLSSNLTVTYTYTHTHTRTLTFISSFSLALSPQHTHWSRAHCFGAALENYNALDPQEIEDTLREAKESEDYTTLHNVAALALHDQSWNSLTVHTLGDILGIRIPQLTEQCGEAWNQIKVCDSDADNILAAVVAKYPKVSAWCGVTADATDDDPACRSEECVKKNRNNTKMNSLNPQQSPSRCYSSHPICPIFVSILLFCLQISFSVTCQLLWTIDYGRQSTVSWAGSTQ